MSQYKEFKNMMHNEMSITKEEIRALIKQTIEIEVRKIVEGKQAYIERCVDEYTQHYIESVIRNGLNDGGRLLFGFKERVSSSLSDAVGKFIANQLEFNIRVKGEDEENERG